MKYNLEIDGDYHNSINKLVDLILDCTKEIHTHHLHHHAESVELEPFEMYVQKIHSRQYADSNKFRDRFINGCNLLADEFENEKNG